VNHNWSSESWPAGLLFPGERQLGVLIGWESLTVQFGSFSSCSRRLLILGCDNGFGSVLEVKTDWILEIQLNSTTLMCSLKSIVHFYVNLWSIESTIRWVEFPWLSKLVECLFESCFGFVPKRLFSDSFLWSGGELKFKFESEQAVDMVKEIKVVHDFVQHLLFGTELMGVILAESSDSG